MLRCRAERRCCLLIAAAVWMLAAGCGKKSTLGGPGSVTVAGKVPPGNDVQDIFRIVVPKSPVRLRRGSSADAMLGIERGKTFDQDVLLKFADLPNGVVAAPAEPVIRRGHADTNVRFSAGREAALGSATVKVLGNPYNGPEARSEFKLDVER